MTKLVLTVDDSRTMRDMLRHALTEAGYRVVQAVDGVHGLEVLADGETPDVIVTDINMPRMDGLLFCKRLRERPDTANVPVLLCSMQGLSADQRELATGLGVAAILSKPVSIIDLLDRIERVLRSPNVELAPSHRAGQPAQAIP